MSDLNEIINWRRWDARITLSGQPSEAQLALIAKLGVTRIINLGPHSDNGALVDEPSSVAGLGMAYIHIPVEFASPVEADIAAFCVALAAELTTPLRVHCIYNARVSAFFYRFAIEGRGGDPKAAFDLMDSIWRPGGVWAQFIGRPEDLDQPRRYKGYDY